MGAKIIALPTRSMPEIAKAETSREKMYANDMNIIPSRLLHSICKTANMYSTL